MQKNVLEYLENIIKVCPEKTAFESNEEGISFLTLYKKARAIGSYMAEKEICGKPVALLLPKSPMAVAAFFGCIYAGCIYTPIDPGLPKNLLKEILKKLDPPIMICSKETADAAKKSGFSGQICDITKILDGCINEEKLKEIRTLQKADDPLYIVFTSGSTGKPKGVVATHYSVIDYTENLGKELGFNKETVFGNLAPIFYDAFLKELYPTVKYGAKTVFIPEGTVMFPGKLISFLNEKKINTVCFVSSAFSLICALGGFEEERPEYLKTVAFGGERLPVKYLKEWQKAAPEADFFNLYGVTECTGMSCFYKVNRDFCENENIPIGRPFDGTKVLLLKEDGKVAKDGEEGEICIEGASLTLGYYKDKEKTDKAFVKSPHGDLMYKTGDLGVMNAKGELMFLGRKDSVIKHMGHKVSLLKVEETALALPEVKESACIFNEEKNEISLFYTGDLSEKEVYVYLKKSLAAHELPGRLKRLEEVPHLSNGKTNKKALQ
jgi:amino acid adenylation domain-containing protein